MKNTPEIKKYSRTIVEFNPYDFEGYARTMTTFSEDSITREELENGDRLRLLALTEILSDNHMEVHTDDNGEYISDMEKKIYIEECEIMGIKRDEFYLDESVLYFTGYHWYIINEQGQRIAFSDNGEFRWCENVVDSDGESDFFSDKHDFEQLVECPIDCFLKEGGFYKAIYEPMFLKKRPPTTQSI